MQLPVEGIVVLVLHVASQASSPILDINFILASWMNIANSIVFHVWVTNGIIYTVVLLPFRFRGQLRDGLD